MVSVKDIQGCYYVMLVDMNKDIIVSHVCIIDLHMVSVFLGQSVICSIPVRSFFNCSQGLESDTAGPWRQ